MKCFYPVVIVLVSLAGCRRNQPQSAEKPEPPIALNAPLQFQMTQRSTVALPRSNDRILITIDDITRGQVMMSLSWREGNVIVATRSVRENDRVTFTVDGHTYKIELKQLKNRLVREDTARFELSPAATESEQMLSENDKIEKLISSLRDIDGAKFIRNREEHTVDKAITHLRNKWEWTKAQIKTAEDFIAIVASSSSTTGKGYVIRYSDGSEITSEEWFRKQLQIIEKPPDKELKQYPAAALEKQISITGPYDIELELIYIEPGSFIMGRDTRLDSWLSIINFEFQIYLDEGPPRKVTITKGFYIGKYEVTAAQYCKFLNSPDVNQLERFITFNYWSRIIKRNGRYVPRPETEDCTAYTVPWAGANAFCEWLSKSTGRRFRLPTEAEWEFTARGPEGREFPWGNKEPKWLSEAATDSNEVKFSKPWMGPSVYSIQERLPSDVTPDGVVGMLCSKEWVQDYYADYPRKDEIDPTGPKDPPHLWRRRDHRLGYRVLRKGGLTGRALGLHAEGGGYDFRVLMEVDEDQSEQRKLHSIDVPVEFTVWQRSTTPLPKSDGKLLLTLDDITRGQVLVTVASYDGKPVVATRSLRENDIIEFSVGKHTYKLKLKTLTNKLIGNDSAVFQLWPATPEAR